MSTSTTRRPRLVDVPLRMPDPPGPIPPHPSGKGLQPSRLPTDPQGRSLPPLVKSAEKRSTLPGCPPNKPIQRSELQTGLANRRKNQLPLFGVI